MDGLAQAVGSGTGPGTLSPPVNGFFALYSLQPRQSKRCFSSVFLSSERWFGCVDKNVCVCVRVVLNSVAQKNWRSLKFCSKLSLSVPCL